MVITYLNWDAISSLLTLLGILVALFLPFYISIKEKKNLNTILFNEVDYNYELVEKASNALDNLEHDISRLSIQVALLKEIDLNSWDSLKNTFAAQDSERYIKYKKINFDFLKIRNFSIEIDNKDGNSPAEAYLIPLMITEVLENYRKDFKSKK